MQIKPVEDPIEDHDKQLVESNELLKKDFDIDRDSIPYEEQKNIFNGVIREKSSEFHNSEKRFNPDNLICNSKSDLREIKKKEIQI